MRRVTLEQIPARPTSAWQNFWRRYWVSMFFYSFPVQLLLLNIKKNQLILVLWGILFSIVTESVGSILGIPTLFLEPEYLNEVDFRSYFLMGATLGVFSMSYHISCYIIDSPNFPFLGHLPNPFRKFIVNNSLIPLIFNMVYVYQVIRFQIGHEANTNWLIAQEVAGYLTGFAVSFLTFYLYFIRTNKDIVRLFKVSFDFDNRFRRLRVVRVNVFDRLDEIKHKRIRVDYYLGDWLKPKPVFDETEGVNSYRILQIFDQNHLNAVIIQLAILLLITLLGTFRDQSLFQIPAGASLVLLFTIVLMLAGAFTYWLRGWSFTGFIGGLLFLNYLMQSHIINPRYDAFGLNYETEKAEYSLQRVKELSDDSLYLADYYTTLISLENWRKKFPAEDKPVMVFVCVSGGGQRSAVWTTRTLQHVDSVLNGKLMKHTMLMTGASGGMIGAAYFRELYLRRQSGEMFNIYDERYVDNIARDNLNAIMFSLVVNDLFLGLQTFEYAGQRYFKDRGHALENQINKNTGFILDKPLCDYREPEMLSLVPMLILAPTIVNDGRKLYISPQNVSYMLSPTVFQTRFLNQKTKGIEFLRFFENQNAANLRFLTALRMNATFPYVTPNIKLPSNPQMEIIDAGLSDNFGVSDAIRFMFTFKKWINANTAGVAIVAIRDTQKDRPIEQSLANSIFQRIFTPLSAVVGNLEYIQDIHNDTEIEYAQSWLKVPIHRVEFQYAPFAKSLKELKEQEEALTITQPNEQIQTTGKKKFEIVHVERAPLSWRLTKKDKESIKRTIFEFRNQSSIRHLQGILK
ncbi:MAG TPA: phospholipase [Microscillaceae bacterium]|nr:phospholipase [Microscillaceae bacterium]